MQRKKITLNLGGNGMNGKAALKNVTASLLYQIIITAYGFIVPRIILETFGSEVNGLVSSLNQFLNYITLLEGGVTGVVMAALYEPLAERNMPKVSAIVKSIESFFRNIAKIFLAYSLLVSVLYPIFVDSSFSWLSVFSLALIISVTLFVQYFFSLTFRILINADQKGYIVFITQTAFTILNFVLTILVVRVYPEIHVLKAANAAAYLIQPIVFGRYVKKNFPLKEDAVPDSDVLKQRWDGFGQNLAYFVHTNTDIVVLTIFSTLADVSVYSVYFLVANSLKTLVLSISAALVPSIGNVLVSADGETRNRTFDFYEFGIYFVTTFAFTCGIVLITPFISVYTAGIHDADYYQPVFGTLLMVAEGLYCLRDPFVSVAYASGHFRQTSRYAYIEAGLNIVVSVLLVRRMGLIGVAIGTAVSMLYRMVSHVIYLNNNILDRPVRKWLKSIAVFGGTAAVSVFVCNSLPRMTVTGYGEWILSALLTSAVVGLLLLGSVLLLYRSMTISLLNRIGSVLHKSK